MKGPSAAARARIPLVFLLVAALNGCATPRKPLPPAGEKPAVAPAEDSSAAGQPAAEPTGNGHEEAVPAAETDQPVTLDVETAVALALRHSPELAALRAAVCVAIEERRAALALRDPELRFSYGQGGTDTERTGIFPVGVDRGVGLPPLVTGYVTNTLEAATSSDHGYEVALRLFPPNPFVMRAAAMSGDATVRAAAATLRAAEWRIASDVKRLFNEMQWAERELVTIRTRLKLSRELYEETKIQASPAKRAKQTTDVATAARRYHGVLRRLADREGDVETAREAIASYVGMRAADLRIRHREAVPAAIDIEKIDMERLERFALSRRADIEALRAQEMAARGRLAEVRSQAIPWFAYLQGSLSEATTEDETDLRWRAADGSRYADPSPPTTFDTETSVEWRLDARVQIPLFSLPAALRQRRATEYGQYAVQVAEVEKSVVLQVRNAVDALRSAQQNMTRYAADADPLVAEMKELLRQFTDEQGKVLVPFLEDAMRLREELIRAEDSALETAFAYREAVIRLEEAIGGSLEEFLRALK
ncbi:MAG: TolC family protein [Kiritimatiellae bacterium]|nr:TolC family protein [Kiritimatiellia bacterium]